MVAVTVLSLRGAAPVFLRAQVIPSLDSHVNAATYYAVYLDATGTVYAWGYNEFGQLGDGTTDNHGVPMPVKNPDGTGVLTNIKSIATGEHFTLALANDGTVFTWGMTGRHNLVGPATTYSALPVKVKGENGVGELSNIKAVFAESFTSLALAQDGTVYSWGWNSVGQLGNGTTVHSEYPVKVKNPSGTGDLTGITAIVASGNHSYALAGDGSVYAWGYNDTDCRLGIGTTDRNKLLPVKVKDPGGAGTLSGIKAIATGVTHALALGNDARVYTWGGNLNALGALGDGTNNNACLPIRVKKPDGTGELSDIREISGANSHSMALANDGKLYEWGRNYYRVVDEMTYVHEDLLPKIVRFPLCTDGFLDPGEACDDGNAQDGDGCSAACAIEADTTCSSVELELSVCQKCGNGRKEGVEACDDGNDADGDGCTVICAVEAGYACAGIQPNVCQKCQNGKKEGTEGCDDGNTNGTDGCTNTCTVMSGWTCTGIQPSVCYPPPSFAPRMEGVTAGAPGTTIAPSFVLKNTRGLAQDWKFRIYLNAGGSIDIAQEQTTGCTRAIEPTNKPAVDCVFTLYSNEEKTFPLAVTIAESALCTDVRTYAIKYYNAAGQQRTNTTITGRFSVACTSSSSTSSSSSSSSVTLSSDSSISSQPASSSSSVASSSSISSSSVSSTSNVPVCGNNVCEANEDLNCPTGGVLGPCSIGTCLQDCPGPCGNGKLNYGEQCENGVNMVPCWAHVPDATCQNCHCTGGTSSSSSMTSASSSSVFSLLALSSSSSISARPLCGNTRLEAGEQCERGSGSCPTGWGCDYTSCQCLPLPPVLPGSSRASSAMPLGPVCGNNILDPGEQCESGISCPTGLFCTSFCQCQPIQASSSSVEFFAQVSSVPPPPRCGDSLLTIGEQCEVGMPCPAGQVCDGTCLCIILSPVPNFSSAAFSDASFSDWDSAANTPSSLCGNALTEPPEECDDQNLIDDDGCSPFCTLNAGFTCSGSPSTCQSICGDGIHASSEECDDGNFLDGDGCSALCTSEHAAPPPPPFLPICGNGILEESEECDDANPFSEDGCSSTCTLEMILSSSSSEESSFASSESSSSSSVITLPTEPEQSLSFWQKIWRAITRFIVGE